VRSNRFSRSGIAIACLVCTAYSFAGSWKFLVYGDSRGTSHDDQVADEILSELVSATISESPDFILFPGDLVYWGKMEAFLEWKAVMQPIYDAGIEVYPVMGNHDTFDTASYLAVFGKGIPDNGPVGEIGRTYAILHSNVCILALDVYTRSHQVNQQWVDEQLYANELPHVFAFSHEPAFKVQHTDCLDDFPSARDAFWASLENAGAHAYFAGHDHLYSHARIDNGDGNNRPVVHQYVVGTAGAPLYGTATFNGDNGSRIPANIFFELQYGYTVVEINGMDVTITWKHRTAPGVFETTADVLNKRTRPNRPFLNITPGISNVVLDVSGISPFSTNTIKGCANLLSNNWVDVRQFVVSSNSYRCDFSLDGSNEFYRVLSE
jgi:hypothetical protein